MLWPEKWIVPRTVREAVKCLCDNRKAAIPYAGGTNIYELARRGLLDRVRVVVDLRALNLAYIKNSGGRVRIGAGATMTMLLRSDVIKASGLKAFRLAAMRMGPRQVRDLATLGGALACSLPMVDVAVPLLVLGAKVKIAGPKGTSYIDLWKLRAKSGTSGLAYGNLIVEVEVESPGRNMVSYYRKMAKRAAHWPLAGVAIAADIGPNGLCKRVEVATGCVSYGYSRHNDIGRLLVGKPLDQGALEAVSKAVSEGIRPKQSEIAGSNDYQRALLGALTREVADVVFSGANGGS